MGVVRLVPVCLRGLLSTEMELPSVLTRRHAAQAVWLIAQTAMANDALDNSAFFVFLQADVARRFFFQCVHDVMIK